MRMILSTSGKIYVDHNINACKWIENMRINFVIEVFKSMFEKYFDPRVLTCPIKRGRYMALAPRPMPVSLGEFTKAWPVFIPFKGEFNYTVVIKTKVRGKLRPFYMATYLFEVI
jgi:hypothetical protein